MKVTFHGSEKAIEMAVSANGNLAEKEFESVGGFLAFLNGMFTDINFNVNGDHIDVHGNGMFLGDVSQTLPATADPSTLMIELTPPEIKVKKEPIKKFAIVVLTDKVTVREFEYEDDFKTARQTLATKGTKFIPLKYHNGVRAWQQPEVVEY